MSCSRGWIKRSRRPSAPERGLPHFAAIANAHQLKPSSIAMLPGDPITQTFRCSAHADPAGGTIQLLQFAIALREFQLPVQALHWRVANDPRTVIIELTSVGTPALIERLAERIESITGITEVKVADPA